MKNRKFKNIYMKKNIKILFVLLIFTLNLNDLYSQPKEENNPKKETVEKNLSEKVKIVNDQENLKSQINELNKQINELSKNLADTKQAFYDSKLNLWNFILTGLGILIAVIGFFGYKSISGRINDLKSDNDRSITKSEENIKDIKNDLLQRIIEIKDDIRDFKAEQIRLFDKFEKEANEKMDKGLGSALQEAIEKIMKESFIGEMNGISEQVSDLKNQFENFSSKSNEHQNVVPENNDGLSLEEKTTIKPNKNAFDE